MTTRDPRTDPQKGDRVHQWHYYCVVERRTARDVRCRVTDRDGRQYNERWTIRQWQAFAGGAEVLGQDIASSPRVMDPNNPKGKRRQLTPKRER